MYLLNMLTKLSNGCIMRTKTISCMPRWSRTAEQVMGFTINDLMHIIWLIMFHPIIRLGMIGNTIVTAYPITISTRRATITMRTTTKFTTCMTTVRTTTKTMASTITTRITKTFAAYN